MRFGAGYGRRTGSGWLLWGLLVVSLVAAGLVYYYQNQPQSAKTEEVLGVREVKIEALPPQPSQPLRPQSLRMNGMFFGDVFWGRYTDDWSKKSDLKTAYPFSGLNTLERDKYQAWIADLECPVTEHYLDSAKQDDLLKFNCLPEYVPEAAKWFTAFTLANNHMDNMQEYDGLNQTRQNLEKNGIQYFGHYDSAVKADLCEVVSLPAKAVYEGNAAQDKDYYMPFALCGFHNVFKLPKDDELAVIADYSKYFPTIIMPHQGQEYKTVHDQLQETVFRRMIDLGADAVIGDHPHAVQDSEAYKGKLILYSVGNFMFDQQSSMLVRTGIGANLDFTFKYDDNLEKWQQIAAACKKFKDDCLDQARKLNLKKPEFEIKYDFLATDNSNKLAKKAGPEVQSQMRARLNWDKTLIGLKPGTTVQ